MLSIEKAFKINKYGQNLADIQSLVEDFENLPFVEKKDYLKELIVIIHQSKPHNDDIETAILQSKLKPTFTPCVLLNKGIENHHLQKISELPEYELTKVLVLFLNLFKLAYQRRFNKEINNPHKWWYWDLKNNDNEKIILGMLN